VLAPTRELAQQIEKVMRALGDYLQVRHREAGSCTTVGSAGRRAAAAVRELDEGVGSALQDRQGSRQAEAGLDARQLQLVQRKAGGQQEDRRVGGRLEDNCRCRGDRQAGWLVWQTVRQAHRQGGCRKGGQACSFAGQTDGQAGQAGRQVVVPTQLVAQQRSCAVSCRSSSSSNHSSNWGGLASTSQSGWQ
jgi:hypothetical protein